MDWSRFNEMIGETLMTRCRSRGFRENNAVTVASKLLEISYAMGHIEREFDECETVIIENVQRHELMATIIRQLEADCDELAASDDTELRDFEDNDARPLMVEIEKVRDAFSRQLRVADESNRRNDSENQAGRQKLGEIIREMTNVRDEVAAEINTVDQGIALITSQLDDIAGRIQFEKLGNAAFHEGIEHKQNDLLRRSRESLAKLNHLLASKD